MFGTSNVPVATVDSTIALVDWHVSVEAFHTYQFLVFQWKVYASDGEDVVGCAIVSCCSAAMGWMHVQVVQRDRMSVDNVFCLWICLNNIIFWH